MFAVSLGWGPPLQRLWFKHLGPASSMVAAFLLNLVTLAAICLFLLWTGRFEPGMALAIWLACFLGVALLSGFGFLDSYRHWANCLHRCVLSTAMSRWLYLIWSLTLIHAFLYPFTAWDTLMRYALLGRRFATRGAFHYPALCPDEFMDLTLAEGYPPLMPGLFGWFFMWTEHELPSHILTPVFLGIHLLALDGLAGRWSRRLAESPGWTPVLYMLFPRVLYFAFSKQGYLDEPMTLFFTASVLFLLSNRSDRRLVPVAVALGFWTKFSAPLMVGVLAVAAWGSGPGRARGWAYSWLGVAAGLPWMLRNLFLVGDPLYPLLYPLLGDKSQWLNDTLYHEAYGIWKAGPAQVLKELVLSIVVMDGLPWVAVPGIGVWILGMRNRRTAALAGMSSIMVAAAMIQGRYELRLVQFVLVPLCVASAQGFLRQSSRQRRAFQWILCFWLGLSVCDAIRVDWLGMRWRYWSYLFSPYETKRREILYPASEMWRAIDRLPEDSVVLLPDSRHYAISRSCFSLRNPLLRDFVQGTDPEDRLDVLKGLGITHVALYPNTAAQESHMVKVSRPWNILEWSGVQMVYHAEGGVLLRLP